jgi:cytochrome d ubiquinol oxidase subunit I
MLKGDEKKAPRLALTTAIVIAAILAPLQAYVGDLHGLNTLEHQPEKIAAMEGLWETKKGAPLLLFALPDEEERKNTLEIGIPKLASLILTHETDGELKGLNEFQSTIQGEAVFEHPPMTPLFFGFRLMVAMGVIMISLAWIGIYFVLKRKTLPFWYLKSLVYCTFIGWVATLAGWYVTEIGRQPWLVSGVLKTADAVTSVPPANVGLTLSLYASVYLVLLIAYIHTLFVMARRSVEVEEFDLLPSRDTPERQNSMEVNA